MSPSAANVAVSESIPFTSTATRVVVSSDGTRAYVTTADSTARTGSVSVIDTATFTTIGAPVTFSSILSGVALSHDGARLYVSSKDAGTVSVIDTATNTIVGTPIAVGLNPGELAVSPDGTRLYVSTSNPVFGRDTLTVVDTTTRTTIGTPTYVGENNYYGGAGSVAVSPDGSRVYVTGYELGGSPNDSTRPYIGEVIAVDTATNTVSARIPIGPNPSALAVSPDGTRVYVSSSASLGGGTVAVIDTATDTTIGSPVNVGYDLMSGLAVSPDGTRVYVTGLTVVPLPTALKVIDTSTRFVSSAPLKLGFDEAVDLAVSPDGTRLYVTHANPLTLAGAVSWISTSALDPNSAAEKQRESFYRETGWIPVWGSVLSAVNVVFDFGEFVSAVASGNIADVADEAGDLVCDVIGIGLGVLPGGTGIAAAAGDAVTRIVGSVI